jgi:hypothetical protein
VSAAVNTAREAREQAAALLTALDEWLAGRRPVDDILVIAEDAELVAKALGRVADSVVCATEERRS